MTVEWQFDLSQRARSLSSFESLEHLEKAQDHTLWIVGTDRPWVRILRKRYRPELGDTDG
jgi:hypothetical protein